MQKVTKKFMSEIMLRLLLLNVVEVKKKGRMKNRWIQKKIDDFRIWNFRMPRIRSQIKNRKHICK